MLINSQQKHTSNVVRVKLNRESCATKFNSTLPPMACPEFWHKDNKPALKPEVKGFIVALPTQWTGSENNNSGFHLTMLAGLLPKGGILVAAASTPSAAKA